jgi:sulfonate transport system permease protein
MIRAIPFVDIANPPELGRHAHQRSQARPATRLRAVALGAIVPLAVLAVWSVAVTLNVMRSQILPSPLAVWAAAADLLRSGDLAAAMEVSLGRVALGLAVGSAVGLVAGAALGRSRTLDAYFGPTLRAICQIPTIAWLPVFMLIFGIGEELKIAIIAKAAFLPMLLNTFAGVRTAPVRYHEVADVLEFGPLQRLRYVTVPSALPMIVSGLRLALSNAWHVLIVVEMLASASGIGHLMAWSRTLFQLDVVFVTVVAIGATGWLMDATMRAAERHLSPWSAPA